MNAANSSATPKAVGGATNDALESNSSSTAQLISKSSSVAPTSDIAVKKSSSTKSTSTSISEDYIIFGTAPSQLFDSISITLDNLLTKEVGSLPLLPKTPSDANSSGNNDKKVQTSHLSGEEKILHKLRTTYKKNLDLVEAYCARNIFTIHYFSKTKRRKIVERFLAANDQSADKSDDDDGNAIQSLSNTNFSSPPPDALLPTPQQIIDMDREILLARQQLHFQKQRRDKLVRQLEKVSQSCSSLQDVETALEKGLKADESSSGFDDMTEKLKEIENSVKTAMEGHEELKTLNVKAVEVIHLLDKIKKEREEGVDSAMEKKMSEAGKDTKPNRCGMKRARVAVREEDEQRRKRVWAEMSDENMKNGGINDVKSLLKKLRGDKSS
ncbi:hypothetical protein ACHAXS_012649 [Conticribra weissflogii]